MNVLTSGDWHKKPHELSPELPEHLDYIDHKLRSGWLVILTGDLFDALEYGWQSYASDPILYRVIHWANLSDCIILEGNHDRHSPYFPQQLFAIIEKLTYVSHWDEFDLLWGWLPIHRFPVPDFIRKLYRTPAKVKAQGKLQDWHFSTIACESRATNFAIKHNYRSIIGSHTHSPVITIREGITVANAGDMVDSFSWLEREDGKWDWKKKI